MTDEEQLSMLRRSVEEWNNWRNENPNEVPNLSRADLSHADLGGANLERANFGYTDLSDCNLTGANLSNANFYAANLNYADLSEANLEGAYFSETVLTNVYLAMAMGLDSCIHSGPSGVDHRTLAKSRNVPLVFWRGCGLPDWQIEAGKLGQPGLTQEDVHDIGYEVIRIRASQPIQLSSLCISSSSRDDMFAKRLYNTLRSKGIHCWYAPEDMKIGDRIRSRIDEAIYVHDKLLLVLSEHSVASQWVEQEVETALAKERETDETVLFPIKVDHAVDDIERGWPALIRNTRHIGDFTNWNDGNAFEAASNLVIQHLRAIP